jgi:DNA-directed RNA polymerase specialized sigma24 family protein
LQTKRQPEPYPVYVENTYCAKQSKTRGLAESDWTDDFPYEQVAKNLGMLEEFRATPSFVVQAIRYTNEVINFTPHERTVVALRVFHCFSVRLIAEMMRTEPCAVRRYWRRALKKMQQAPPSFSRQLRIPATDE